MKEKFPETNENPENQFEPTPEWIKTLCPQLADTLPVVIIQELEEWRKKVESQHIKYRLDIRNVSRESVSSYMNNFILRVNDRRSKDPNQKPSMPQELISDTLRGKTWREFYEEIDEALKQTTGLSVKEVKKLSKGGDYSDINLRLLPAFIFLRQKGYKRYPDLAL
ncbi:MAG: hypothetical protein A2V81_01475 [Candidatus Abawacabacteria bacterium RBG_16_42_10]|uniref:Uncharacterized protein n=1 Tax=Candidatus Abawacabacteria bacterium RBG_16_42_10 TaxID=1817814 RepID=A0A1F4XKB6_9BACT|nr:MAG: hypothetical protein A2V81_01475 [Candidatus Abawacabacteria bacterium RBG_16_42_10]